MKKEKKILKVPKINLEKHKEAFVDGVDITKLSYRELIKYRRNDIGFVFQFYNLVQNLTALENVELAVQLCKDSFKPKTILKSVGLNIVFDCKDISVATPEFLSVLY